MSQKKNTSAMTNTHIENSKKVNKKVDPDKTPNIMYFGSAKKLDQLDTPAFLAPYKGIAQLFTIRKDNIKKCQSMILKYREWEDLKDERVKKILDLVHIYHNNSEAKKVNGEAVGYIHHIDVSKIKDQLIEVDGSTTEREVLYIGSESLPVVKVEKVTTKFIAEYRGEKADQRNDDEKINDSRVQFEGFYYEDNDDPFQEGYLFSKKDLEFNMNKWPNDKNILFITGHSGSGKTTLAEEMADKNNCTVIQLDWFEMNHMIMGAKLRKQDYGCQLIIKYFTDIRPDLNNRGKGKPGHKDVMDIDNDTFHKLFKQFWEWLFKEIKKDKDRLYVIEGLQLIGHIDLDTIIDYPIIIKNTSALTSLLRRNKRDKTNLISNSWQLKWYIELEQNLNKIRKYLKQQPIQEGAFKNIAIEVEENPYFDIRESEVNGKGTFAKCDIQKDTHIGLAITCTDDTDPDKWIRTGLCQFTNHSEKPNLSISKHKPRSSSTTQKDITYHFYANQDIQQDDELFVDYREFDFEGERDFVKQESVLVTGALIAGGALIIAAIIRLVFKLIKNNSSMALSWMDGQILKGESHLIDEEMRKIITELAKNIPTPVLFVKGIGSGVQNMKFSQVKKLAGNAQLNCANPETLKSFPDEETVILIDVISFKKKCKMQHSKEVNAVFNHELGHINTWKSFNQHQRADHFIKAALLTRLIDKTSGSEKGIITRVYYELPMERAANKNVDVEVLLGMCEGYLKSGNWMNSNANKFIQEQIPHNVIQASINNDQKTIETFYQEMCKKYFPNLTSPGVKQESMIIIQEADIQNKRKQIEDKIFKVFTALDPTGINTKKYQQMFSQMSDTQFKKWIEAFLADPKSGFRWDIEEFGDGSRTPKFENIDKAAGLLGIKLFEYVYMPHVSSNPNRPVRTKLPVLVGKLSIKRPQQFVSKKTNLSLTDTNRDDMTGVAKGESKAGTSTGIENELLQGVGGDIILKEIIGARADNQEEYANMIQQIAETGSVNVLDIKTSVYDKGALLKADLYLMAMGIKTDMISESYYSIEKVRAATRK